MSIRERVRRSFLYTNLSNIEESILFDPVDGFIMHQIDPGVVPMLVGDKDDKKAYKTWLSEHGRLARFIYNPYQEQGPDGWDENDVATFNLYVPPTWRHAHYFKGDLVVPEERVPPLIQKFLRHFSGNDEASEKFILDWLATALRSRNGTYLCVLSKTQGTGKGVLGEMARTIFGEFNVRKVRGDALNGRFNKAFAGAQLVMFDEFDFKDKAALDRAKDLVNDKLEIEPKGKDTYEAENHLNGYFATNRLGALSEDGRRFSIPMTSDVQLKTVFSTNEIRALQYDTEMLEAFARFLWWREVKRDMYIPFVSARTKEVRDYGLKDWESILCEEVLVKCPTGVFIKQADLKKLLKDKAPQLRAAPGRNSFADFAGKFPEHFRHMRRTRDNVMEYGIDVIKALPDFQPDSWCETCESVKPDGCICPRI